MPKISIIIPIHPDETAHHPLITFLEKRNDPDIEVIVTSGKNRANAMNIRASEAAHHYLWFVHADTKLEEKHIIALQNQLKQKPNHIHYFDLKFDKDGPWLTHLNTIGANIRSHLFGLPWGDQALALSKEIFKNLDHYNENLLYGEDHALILHAHKNKIKLNAINIPLITSAREYRKKGWFKLTLLRQYLWIKLTIQEWFK